MKGHFVSAFRIESLHFINKLTALENASSGDPVQIFFHNSKRVIYLVSDVSVNMICFISFC